MIVKTGPSAGQPPHPHDGPDGPARSGRAGIIIDEKRIPTTGWVSVDIDHLARQTGTMQGLRQELHQEPQQDAQQGAEDDPRRALPLQPQQMRRADAIRRADAAAGRPPRPTRLGMPLPTPLGGSPQGAPGKPSALACGGAREAATPDRSSEVADLADEKRQRAVARARSIIPAGRGKPAPTRVIPPQDIIAVGGCDLRTPEQPFPAEDSFANDNRMRAALLTALLIGMVGGYALTTQSGTERNVIEVLPPTERGIQISRIMPTGALGEIDRPGGDPARGETRKIH